MARWTGLARTAALVGLVAAWSGGIGFAEEPAAGFWLDGATAVQDDGHGSAGKVETIDPWISQSVPGTVRSKLEESFALAVSRVQEQPQCGALFARLGEDGVEMLKTTFYFPAEFRFEKRVCSRAYAYTVVGLAPTWLCRRFSRLSDQRAAMVLLHEALHHAGADESHDRSEAMSPREIDWMLSQSCGF